MALEKFYKEANMPQFTITPTFDKDLPRFEQWQKDSGKVGTIWDLCRSCALGLEDGQLFDPRSTGLVLMEGEPSMTFSLVKIECSSFEIPLDENGRLNGAHEFECSLCGELLLPEDE
jgi:hypothetical protein